MNFSGKILLLGCGFVARCTLPLILKHIAMPAKNIIVLDMTDQREYITEAMAAGVQYRIRQITRNNMHEVLSEYVGQGDLIIDVAWYIDCIEILTWCREHGVKYINTSVEVWDDPISIPGPPTEKTLYKRHMALRAAMAAWGDQGPTAVLDHGANPGLVSHFTKVALQDIAAKLLTEKQPDARRPALVEAVKNQDYAKIAQLTGVKVIHVSERDTQITNQPKQVNEFVNTWSIEGFYEEGIAPAEMGWGTHERQLPELAQLHRYGPGNQICLAQMGVKTWVRSWVPSGEITGMVIRHGEAFTISDYLTVWEGTVPIYRPTVHYAYCPCDAAINSLHELEMRQFQLQPHKRIMTNEIIGGQDELGVLVMGHDYKAWWVGSILTIEEARRQVAGQNATTLQVAASIVGAVCWMLRNPQQGVCVPDDLPHDEILSFAKPYLGKFISRQVDWNPLQQRFDLYQAYTKYSLTVEDMWQFKAFIV